MPPLFMIRLFHSPYRQWYWIFRVDIIGRKVKFQFYKHENKCWDLNRLYRDLLRAIKA